MRERNPWRRVRIALLAIVVVLAIGTVGFIVIFGVSVLQALYDTTSVVTTIGFREQPKSTGAKVFSIFLILAGVGTVLYAFGVVLEAIIEGQLGDLFGRRRMEKKISGMGLLVELNETQKDVAHRAAKLYQFDRDRYRELVRQGFNFEV